MQKFSIKYLRRDDVEEPFRVRAEVLALRFEVKYRQEVVELSGRFLIGFLKMELWLDLSLEP